MKADLARIEEIFTQAVAKADPAERAACLDEACGGDAELRQKLEDLIAADADAATFLPLPNDGSTAIFTPVSERPGTVIGRYKLLEQIGEGGFGVVFMAEQEQPVRRRVALKIIKAGMDTRQVVARFEAERQALAMMDHPNIAKVFDAGATETGRPYFVMELVRGVPITEYCDEVRLTTNERLELFQSVCAAIQHAHQKGIIHRDLKPSNVLVTMHDDKAVPKVIDFGVAKATQGRLTERTLFTEFRAMIGTPNYMSPEQAHMSGLDVDTRSDIYSLGVLLYELLTGTTPIDTKQVAQATYDDLRRMICEVEPPRPSARLSTLSNEQLTTLARQRHCEPAQLAVSLRSDLDWIVMRCLEKDRARRYQTANGLAADIMRYLNNEPVEACPPSVGYRLKKFVRRNKVGVLAGTAITTALIIGLVLATVGLIQARRQAARSEQMAEFLKDVLKSAGASTVARRQPELVRGVLSETSGKIQSKLGSQPDVQGDMWMTLGETFQLAGDYANAVEMYQHAVDSYQIAFGKDNAKLALALAHVGESQNFIGNYSSGVSNCKIALAMARKHGDADILAYCLSAGASSFDFGMASPEAAPLLREAVALLKDSEKNPEMLADCMRALAYSLTTKDIEEAEAWAHNSLLLHGQHLKPEHPKIVDDMLLLGQIHLINGKSREAENLLRETLALYAKVQDKNYTYRRTALSDLAFVLDMQGKVEEALALLRSEMDPSEGAEIDDFVWFNLGILLLKNGREEEYRQHCHAFLEHAANKREFFIADKAAKVSLLLPVGGEDLQRALRLADFALTKQEEWTLPWASLVKTMAEYRRDNFKSASEWAKRTIAVNRAGVQCRAAAWFIEAASSAKLDHVESAKAAFAMGIDLQNEGRSTVGFAFRWPDWMIADVLRREALEHIGADDLDLSVDSAPEPAATDPQP